MGTDRSLIAAWLEQVAMEYRGGMSGVDRDTRVGRTTLYKVRNGQPVSERTYAHLEVGLNLPIGTIAAIGAHDWQRMEDALGKRMTVHLREQSKLTPSVRRALRKVGDSVAVHDVDTLEDSPETGAKGDLAG